jgi:hypothetical protein
MAAGSVTATVTPPVTLAGVGVRVAVAAILAPACAFAPARALATNCPLTTTARVGAALAGTVLRSGGRPLRSRLLPCPTPIWILAAGGPAAIPFSGPAPVFFAVRKVRALLITHVSHADRDSDDND